MAQATFGARLLLGRRGGVPADPGRDRCRGRLCRRHGGRPSYEQVCTGRTGHAEVVQVEYDPGAGQLRAAARGVLRQPRSDPAQPSGPDVGTQYRSVIFYHDEAQAEAARAAKAALQASGRHRRPVVTEIVPSRTSTGRRNTTSAIWKGGLAACALLASPATAGRAGAPASIAVLPAFGFVGAARHRRAGCRIGPSPLRSALT